MMQQYARRRMVGSNRLYLIRNGDQCIGVTGGWKTRAWAIISNWQGTNPTMTQMSDNIQIYLPNRSTGKSGAIETIQDIDVTQYNTLYVDAAITISPNTQGTADGRLGLILPRDSTYYGSGNICTIITGDRTEYQRTIFQENISNVVGSYDIANAIHVNRNAMTINIYNLWLE